MPGIRAILQLQHTMPWSTAMRKGLLAVAVLVFSSTELFAQTLPPVTNLGTPAEGAPMIDLRPANAGNGFRIWGSADYLLWWVKNAPMPVPLVTTGDPNVGFPLVNSAGALGQPSTRVLFGNSDVNFGTFSGMSFTLGGWFDTDHILGIEGSGFLLEKRSNQFGASSDSLGNPPLYIPAYNIQAGAERALAVSDPLRGFAGNVYVTSTLQLWGAECNGLFNVWRRPGFEASLLVGFRYASLNETLLLHNSTSDLIFIDTDVLNDHFDTQNQFYGGQIGSRVSWQRDRFFVDLTTKVALGVTHQVVNTYGDITQSGPGAFAPGTFPGGLFTQPSNIGRRSGDEFTVLPSVELKLGYQVTPRIRAFAGYDFMYWNQVVRPGNEIDRNVNTSQSPIFGAGALMGQASPAPLFNRTDFWAQGVNFGFEFRY